MILIGVDVGGTFTDIILADTAKTRLAIHKLPTTLDPSDGVVTGIRALCSREGVAIDQVDYLFHGTTVATNAMLEHKGARTGMITTQGYRDIIHIGRHQRPQNYSILQDIPWQARPLVQRRHRKTVAERLIPPLGEELVPLDEAEVRARLLELKAEGMEAIAVCFLFSYLNPKHEDRVCALAQEEFPEAFVTSSAEVCSQFREFERFTTACMNAFLGPKVKQFVVGLTNKLEGAGLRGDVHIMTSNGGVATARTIARKPVYSLLSGLAAGVLGGEWVGKRTQRANLITFDVGGTSADIGIVTARGIAEASARDTRIAGFPVLVPMIDVHTIGAGGGSVAYIDAGGAFRVGPRSAGSIPGPACYGQGGEEPTVTDANVVLGRLHKDHFLGGEMAIYPERAFAAIGKLASALGCEVHEAAEGVSRILASNMANAIRSRTVQKGHDPRMFSLVAFGGGGPMTAVDVAQQLKIPEVVVPIYPGITSAFGLLTTDLKYEFVKTELLLSTDSPASRLRQDMQDLEQNAREQLLKDGLPEERISFQRSLDLRYLGQGYELRIAIQPNDMEDGDCSRIWKEFHDRHRSEYGHAFGQNPIEVVNLRVVGLGRMPRLPDRFAATRANTLEAARLNSGETYFRVKGTLQKLRTEFFDRMLVPAGSVIPGPAVLFQKDTTTVVPPGWSGASDDFGNLVITRNV
ncbi:MAG TPA: hydantoinase/oxoprolinase family protein [Candidatus Sulfotelmatobacter sp.]|nr:hydantoinase/oxoprolinase family protein [Candidatus Sulfotelmatobacter sp.]